MIILATEYLSKIVVVYARLEFFLLVFFGSSSYVSVLQTTCPMTFIYFKSILWYSYLKTFKIIPSCKILFSNWTTRFLFAPFSPFLFIYFGWRTFYLGTGFATWTDFIRSLTAKVRVVEPRLEVTMRSSRVYCCVLCWIYL